MKVKDVVLYGALAVGGTLALTYSSVNVLAAGDTCRSGTCDNGRGQCGEDPLPGYDPDDPSTYNCACFESGHYWDTTDCVC
jgi:hypothetical protein